MCGIFGVYLSDPMGECAETLLRSMGDAIRHRGPDDEGFFRDGPLGLGMRRLSIIDLRTGHQPIHNEDGSLQIVFNGEIYNYRELVGELVRRGHSLYTTSDTEVIVHLYEEYGKACVNHLRGMFAFAVWDAKTRTLFLARDRVGIKPLYYARTSIGLLFGSELKSLLRAPEVQRDVSPEGLLAYLQFGYVPDPLSIFTGVHKLPPGHCLTVRQDGALQVERYWDPAPYFDAPLPPVSEAALLEELRWRLRESVRLHLVSDVPLGAFLSGGIDSTSVVALLTAELGGSVKTFSIGFEEEAFNELPYARIAAQRLGTEHYELIVRPGSLDLLETLVESFDEPFADASAIPTYLVSRLAREQVKVVLSGDGGDELFAGYDRYQVDHRRRHWELVSRIGAARPIRRVSEALPAGTRGKNFLFNVSLPRMERYLDSISYIPPRRFRELLAGDLMATLRSSPSDLFAHHLERSTGPDFTSRLQYLDFQTYLPGDILTKVDRMSMANSLEARVPLLDHTFVEFVATIPARYKLRGGETKHLFKRAMQELLPPEILSRPKHGFGIPLESWFRRRLPEVLQEYLTDSSVMRHGYFNRPFVEDLVRRYVVTARSEYLSPLWMLLIFELWHRAYVQNARPR